MLIDLLLCFNLPTIQSLNVDQIGTTDVTVPKILVVVKVVAPVNAGIVSSCALPCTSVPTIL